MPPRTPTPPPPVTACCLGVCLFNFPEVLTGVNPATLCGHAFRALGGQGPLSTPARRAVPTLLIQARCATVWLLPNLRGPPLLAPRLGPEFLIFQQSGRRSRCSAWVCFSVGVAVFLFQQDELQNVGLPLAEEMHALTLVAFSRCCQTNCFKAAAVHGPGCRGSWALRRVAVRVWAPGQVRT